MTKRSKSKITHKKHAFQIVFLIVWSETWRRLEVTVDGLNHWRKCVRIIYRSCLCVVAPSRPDLGMSIVLPDWWNRLVRATNQHCNACYTGSGRQHSESPITLIFT